MTNEFPPSSFDDNPEFYEEGWVKKLSRKLKEEPLIPIGCGVTVWAFLNAAKNYRRGGDPNVTNKYFRYRLYAQGFTITAMIGGAIYYNADRFKRAEYQKMLKKQKEQEKKEKWIRELEAREIEDREWRAKLSKARTAEKEAEEVRLVQEKKARDSAPVTDAIRLQNAAAKTKGNRQLIGVVQPSAGTTNPSSLPKPPLPKPEEDGEEKKFRPILGESEHGGLFGIGYIKALWKIATTPKELEEGEVDHAPTVRKLWKKFFAPTPEPEKKQEEKEVQHQKPKSESEKQVKEKQVQQQKHKEQKQQVADQKVAEKTKVQEAKKEPPK